MPAKKKFHFKRGTRIHPNPLPEETSRGISSQTAGDAGAGGEKNSS